jgi:hypothetical protein
MWGIPTRKTIPYHFNMTTLYHVFGIAVPGLSQKRQRSVSAKLTHEASLAQAFASAFTRLSAQPISFMCNAISVNIWTVARTYRPSQ